MGLSHDASSHPSSSQDDVFQTRLNIVAFMLAALALVLAGLVAR